MTVQQKVNELRKKIDDNILPLITSDYVLWGLPYYENPGDTLIWDGALNMLKRCPHRCVGTCGWEDYEHVALPQDTVILIMGGGYFGDMWRYAWDKVMKTITVYPDNTIVILPQSVYYEDEDLARKDAAELSKLRKLTICVRDEQSYEYARRVFAGIPTVLAPDLAFHADLSALSGYAVCRSDRTLYLKRNDKELPSDVPAVEGDDVDISDWPIMTYNFSAKLRFINMLIKWALKWPSKAHSRKMVAYLYKEGNRKVVLRDTVRFLSPYCEVYTTRLHAMILAFLLNRKIYILDNSYGKISSFYRTWLTDCPNVEIYGK